MIPQLYRSRNQSHIALNSAQLDEIVAAILAGKYSWACFLLLRGAGYNPLDYIPYRTYNRLLKENCQIGKTKKAEDPSTINKIGDLDYLEVVRESKSAVQGGYQSPDLIEIWLETTDWMKSEAYREWQEFPPGQPDAYHPKHSEFFAELKNQVFRFWRN